MRPGFHLLVVVFGAQLGRLCALSRSGALAYAQTLCLSWIDSTLSAVSNVMACRACNFRPPWYDTPPNPHLLLSSY